MKPAMRSEWLRQILTFASVGVVATLVHYGVALAAANWLPIAFANPVGFAVAFLVSYFGHVHFTFQVKKDARRHRHRAPRFLATAVGGFLIGQAILLALVNLTSLPDWLALAIAVGSVPVMTFLVSKLWVFREIS